MRQVLTGCIRLVPQAHLRMLGPENLCCVPGGWGWGGGWRVGEAVPQAAAAFRAKLVSPPCAVPSCWCVCAKQLEV